jgi:hypothetical protein
MYKKSISGAILTNQFGEADLLALVLQSPCSASLN